MWILILLLVAVGLLIMILTKINRRKQQTETKVSFEMDEECCGAHEVCDKDSLLNNNPEVVYFDDEELDVLAGKPASDYNDRENAMINEIFYTLRETDVAGWLKSLQLRQIELPAEIREQALMIVSERRSVS